MQQQRKTSQLSQTQSPHAQLSHILPLGRLQPVLWWPPMAISLCVLAFLGPGGVNLELDLEQQQEKKNVSK